MPALQQREAVRKTSTASELGASVLLHVLVLGGILLSGVVFRDKGQRWGDQQDLSGAVQATAVTAIPLPPRVQPKEDNVLASESPSVAPPPVKPPTIEPPPKPTDVPVVVKRPEKKEPPRKVAEKPTPELPKIKQPPPQRVEPQRATSGATGGVRIAMQAVQNRVGTSAINVTDQSFGARFGYYVRQMNQRISQEWLTQSINPQSQGRRVYLTFRIDRSGGLSEVRIVQSSGDRSLDASAVRALERIDTLSPLPEDYTGSYITVQYYFEPS